MLLQSSAGRQVAQLEQSTASPQAAANQIVPSAPRQPMCGGGTNRSSTKLSPAAINHSWQLPAPAVASITLQRQQAATRSRSHHLVTSLFLVGLLSSSSAIVSSPGKASMVCAVAGAQLQRRTVHATACAQYLSRAFTSSGLSPGLEIFQLVTGGAEEAASWSWWSACCGLSSRSRCWLME